MEAKNVADLLAEALTGDPAVKSWSGTCGGREFKGWQVNSSEDEEIKFYLFSIPVKTGSATLQVIDNRDDGEPSKEFRDAMEMLGKTLKSGER